MSQSGTKIAKPQSSSSSQKLSQNSATSSASKNKRIDDFFSYSNSKSESSMASSGVKTSTSNNEKDKEPPVYLNKKKERDQSDKEPKPGAKGIKSKKIKEKKNKKICSICLDGGDLLLCDRCPNSFHITCLKINANELPKGNWYCNDCLLSNKSQKQKKTNSNKNKAQKKAEVFPSVMNSFFDKSNTENRNDNQNIDLIEEQSLLSMTTNTANSKVSIDEGIIPKKVLDSFSKEEQNYISKYFIKHKPIPKIIQAENNSNGNLLPKNVFDLIKESAYVKLQPNEKQNVMEQALASFDNNTALLSKANISPTLYHDVSRQFCLNLLKHRHGLTTNKYPIDDKELYSNPTLHLLPLDNLCKPEGTLIKVIDPKEMGSLLKIWDFIESFAFLTSMASFSPESLYLLMKNTLKASKEIALINEVYCLFVYILVKEVQETDLVLLQGEREKMMIKIICNNNNIKEFIKHSWPELIRFFVQFDSDTLLSRLPSSHDIVSYINHLAYEDHITLLNYLLEKAIETDFLRSIIKEGQEKRDELKRKRRDYEEELRVKQSRKKELERQQKYTQPLMKIEALKRKLETLKEDHPDLHHKSLSSLRKCIEHQIEEFKSIIKEEAFIKEEEIDILNQIEIINNDILNIGVIDKKYIGSDVLRSRYFVFPWVKDKIYIHRKQLGQWFYLSSIEEVDDLIQKLSEKGIREGYLKKKILKVYPKHLNLNEHKRLQETSELIYRTALQWDNGKSQPKDVALMEEDIEDEVIDINLPSDAHRLQAYEHSLHKDISKKMNVIEELMTECLSFEGNQWESFDTRCNVKSWLSCINSLDEYKKTLTLWINRSKYPYRTTTAHHSFIKMIDDNGEYNSYHSLIDSKGSLSYETINPSLQLAHKTKFWSREYEGLGIERLFNDYLSEVASFPGFYFILFFFESLYNELTKQRDFSKKKSDIATVNAVDIISSYAYKPKEDKTDQPNGTEEGKVKSRLRKSLPLKSKPQPLQMQMQNSRRGFDWDETCMFCGEFGDLICCEECSNVTHLYCAGMKKIPDAWLCEKCQAEMKEKRITRSRGRYFK